MGPEGSSAPRAYTAVGGRDMENYWEQIDENYRGLVNSFAYYTHLIDELNHDASTELRPLCEMFDPIEPDRHVIGLRHDVDADPVTALRAARYLARVGVGGSFYLLHTAAYYGDFHGRTFVRNPELPRWIKGLVVAGCEIGLHNDAMGVETLFDCDGADSVVQELAWLRAHGAHIRGTVAHNSLPLYGAENYEVFEERVLWNGEPLGDERRDRLPIGALKEADLNLQYEGTFARARESVDADSLQQFVADSKEGGPAAEAWMRKYLLDNPYCEWGTDFQMWLVGRDKWTFGGSFAGDPVFESDLRIDRVVELLKTLPPGSRTSLLIHPVYVRGE